MWCNVFSEFLQANTFFHTCSICSVESTSVSQVIETPQPLRVLHLELLGVNGKGGTAYSNQLSMIWPG